MTSPYPVIDAAQAQVGMEIEFTVQQDEVAATYRGMVKAISRVQLTVGNQFWPFTMLSGVQVKVISEPVMNTPGVWDANPESRWFDKDSHLWVRTYVPADDLSGMPQFVCLSQWGTREASRVSNTAIVYTFRTAGVGPDFDPTEVGF